MKKLMLIIAGVVLLSLIFSSCEKEEPMTTHELLIGTWHTELSENESQYRFNISGSQPIYYKGKSYHEAIYTATRCKNEFIKEATSYLVFPFNSEEWADTSLTIYMGARDYNYTINGNDIVFEGSHGDLVKGRVIFIDAKVLELDKTYTSGSINHTYSRKYFRQ